MKQIKIRPNKEGKLFITLFGTTYEVIVVKEKSKEDEKENKKVR